MPNVLHQTFLTQHWAWTRANRGIRNEGSSEIYFHYTVFVRNTDARQKVAGKRAKALVGCTIFSVRAKTGCFFHSLGHDARTSNYNCIATNLDPARQLLAQRVCNCATLLTLEIAKTTAVQLLTAIPATVNQLDRHGCDHLE